MPLLTTEQLKLATKYAKQDVKILKKHGGIAMTETQKGVLMFEFKNEVFNVFSQGKNIFSTSCEKTLINAIVNDFYIID